MSIVIYTVSIFPLLNYTLECLQHVTVKIDVFRALALLNLTKTVSIPAQVFYTVSTSYQHPGMPALVKER